MKQTTRDDLELYLVYYNFRITRLRPAASSPAPPSKNKAD